MTGLPGRHPRALVDALGLGVSPSDAGRLTVLAAAVTTLALMGLFLPWGHDICLADPNSSRAGEWVGTVSSTSAWPWVVQLGVVALLLLARSLLWSEAAWLAGWVNLGKFVAAFTALFVDFTFTPSNCRVEVGGGYAVVALGNLTAAALATLAGKAWRARQARSRYLERKRAWQLAGAWLVAAVGWALGLTVVVLIVWQTLFILGN